MNHVKSVGTRTVFERANASRGSAVSARGALRSLVLAILFVLPAACSRERRATPAGDPCSRLDLSLLDQATVGAYAEAAADLRTRLAEIEGRVFYACDGMNALLGLPRPRNTYQACATFRARVDEARAAGAEISLQVSASCALDGAAGDRCQETCQLESCAAATCPDSAPCRDACAAVAESFVQCTTDTVALTSNVDAELGSAITQNANEWGTLARLVAELQATVTDLGPPLLAYAQTADVIGKDEQDCYQNALGDLGVALISFDAARDGLASLPAVFSPDN